MKLCKITGCDSPVVSLGMCNKHYLHNKRYGTPYTHTTPYGTLKKYPNEWNSYRSMKNRCFCKSMKCYPRYGGRGIAICDRWLGEDGFTNFLGDMGQRPRGTTLDRIDVNGDYEPSNCRWATTHEQRANTRSMKGRIAGVHYIKAKDRWEANIKIGDRRLTKSFFTEKEAIRQREKWEKQFLSNCKDDREEKSA